MFAVSYFVNTNESAPISTVISPDATVAFADIPAYTFPEDASTENKLGSWLSFTATTFPNETFATLETPCPSATTSMCFVSSPINPVPTCSFTTIYSELRYL